MTRATTIRAFRLQRAQRGVAAMEFAIVLPVVLFLFLAVSEFGRAIMHYNTLTRAVRDAARYAASNAIQGQSQVVNVDAQLITEAGAVAAYGTAVGSAAPLLPSLAPANFTVANEGGGIISVTGTYAYQPMLGAILPRVLGTDTTINSAFVMRAQITMRAL